MGASSSEPARPLPALPQQQIVALSPEGGPVGPVAQGRVPVGSTRQAQAVRQPLTLCRDSLQIHGGTVSLEVDAIVEGTVSLFTPATEMSRTAPAAVEGEKPTTLWPRIIADAPGQPFTRRIACGAKQKVSFSNQGEALLPAQRSQTRPDPIGNDSGRRWPLMLLLNPGPPGNWVYGSVKEEPVDGSMLICCVVENGKPKIARQVIAWDKAAYVLQELYGLQEAQNALESETQGLCVVCLSEPKTTALLPCGHFCVCMDCGTSIRITPARNRCPLCRSDVSDLMRMNITSETLQDAAPLHPAGATTQSEDRAATPSGGYPGDINSATMAPAIPTPTAPPASASPEDMRAARLRRLEGVETANKTPSAPDVSSSPNAAASSSSEAVASSSLPARCTKRLAMELKQSAASKQELLEQHGVELSMNDGDDMRTWTAQIFSSSVDPSSEFGKQLKSWSVASVVFEIWIPDTFPSAPPKVRVLSPIFSNGSFWVHGHGALCMETLTKQGWSPAMTLTKLVVQIKVMMTNGKGTISGTGSYGSARESAWSAFDKIEAAHPDWNHFSEK